MSNIVRAFIFLSIHHFFPRIKIVLFIFVAVFYQQWVWAVPYENVAAYGKYFVSRFSPAKVVFVGIGRSPTPIIAFLQEYADLVDPNVQAFNFPLSVDHIRLADEELKEYEPFFRKHMRKFRDIFDSDKAFVVVDYTNSGSSLINATKLIRQFLKSEGRKNKVIPVAIIGDGSNFSGFEVEQVYIAGSLDGAFYSSVSLKIFAEYPRFPLKKGKSIYKAPKRRSEYNRLRAILRGDMQNDADLLTPFDFNTFKVVPEHGPRNLLVPIKGCERFLIK